MSEILVLFACSHIKRYTDHEGGSAEPVCPECGCRTVARVTAPPPRFTVNGKAWQPSPVTTTYGKDSSRG